MFEWVPAPHARSYSVEGFVRHEETRCPDCDDRGALHADGRPRRLDRRSLTVGCETCGGRGAIPDPGKDPMDDPVKNPPPDPRRKTGFGGISGDDRREARRLLDEQLERLELQLAKPATRAEEVADEDSLTRAVDLRDRRYQHGSYAELWRALDGWLRQNRPLAFELAMSVAYHPFTEPPIDPVSPQVIHVCELLAAHMDGPVRVPAYIPVSADAEVERVAREGKGALWWGQTPWHQLKRQERNALIVAMHAEGRSPTAIALRFNLRRRRVQQIVAEHSAAGTATSSGFAA
jgi:hypothetical protein